VLFATQHRYRAGGYVLEGHTNHTASHNCVVATTIVTHVKTKPYMLSGPFDQATLASTTYVLTFVVPGESSGTQ